MIHCLHATNLVCYIAGLEAVLHAQLMQKRRKASENIGNPSAASATSSSTSFKAVSKCTFNLTESTKCGEACIPLSRYCVKHITHDTNQVLFRGCGVLTEADDVPCETPIPDVLEGSTCVYHTKILPSVFEEKASVAPFGN